MYKRLSSSMFWFKVIGLEKTLATPESVWLLALKLLRRKNVIRDFRSLGMNDCQSPYGFVGKGQSEFLVAIWQKCRASISGDALKGWFKFLRLGIRV